MTRFALCCAALLLPLGCVGSPDRDEGGQTSKQAPGGAYVPVDEYGPCEGEDCTGRRPYGAGCEADAELLDVMIFPSQKYGSRTAPAGRIGLYRSPACGTKWAKVWRDEPSYSATWVEAEGERGPETSRETLVEHAAKSWSGDMLYAPDALVRACVQPYACRTACDDPYASTYCTDYR